MEKFAEIIEIYRSCDPVEKEILGLLQLNIAPLSRHFAFETFSRLRPQHFSFVDFCDRLKRLRQRDLILTSRVGNRCADGLGPPILADLLTHRKLGKIIEALDQVARQRAARHNLSTGTKFNIAVRHFLKAIEDAELKDLQKMVWDILKEFPEENQKHPFLEIFFNRPLYPPLLEIFPRPLRAFLLGTTSRTRILSLQPATAIITYLETEKLETEIPLLALANRLDGGDLNGALKLLRKIPAEQLNTPTFILIQGRLHLLRGDNEKALERYRSAYRILHKGLRKNQKTLGYDINSFFYLCAVLESRRPELIKEAVVLLEKSMHLQRGLIFFALFYEVLHLALGRDAVTAFDVPDDLPSMYSSALEKFFCCLLVAWLQPGQLTKLIPTLSELQKQASDAGNRWLAGEYALLLARAGHEPETNRQTGNNLHRELGTVTLTNVFKRMEPWEKLLNRLEELGQTLKRRENAGGSRQRLIWQLLLDESSGHCYDLAPRIQKLSRNGSWTKGRAAALKTLRQDVDKLEFISDQDRKIIGAIRETRYYYGQTRYFIDLDQALPALVGHPLVFLAERPDVAVEIVRRQPELIVERNRKGKLTLRLVPRPDDEQQVLLLRESATRYGLVEFSPALLEIDHLLGDRAVLPPEAKDRLQQSLSALTGMVTIHSDLPEITGDGGETETINGDPRPCLRLLPWNEGLQAELVVKPGGDETTVCKPGRGGTTIISRKDTGGRVIIHRDLEAEIERARQVIDACPTLQERSLSDEDYDWLLPDPAEALELLLETRRLGPEELTVEWPKGEKFKLCGELDTTALKLNIQRKREWFRIGGELKIDPELTLNLKSLLEKLESATGRFLPLDEGTFIALSESLRRKLRDLASCGEPDREGIKTSPLTRLALPDLEDGVGEFTSDQAWQELDRRLDKTITPQLPTTLTAELRDYQRQGFEWLARLSHWEIGACLADDMGLGKTLQALAVILTRAASGPTLVCAPLSVLNNWVEECHRFAPTLKPLIFGPGDRAAMLAATGPFDLVITSYGLLHKESELLSKVEWQTVVLDEAQAIKNMHTKRTRAAMRLKARFRLITTGTPIENHLGELWTLFNFLNPGLLGSYKWFQKRFALPIEKERNRQRRRELNRLIRPFVLRRLKSEVLQELPAKTEITLEVELSPEEASLYTAQRDRALERLESGDEPGHIVVLAEIMKLRRLCCHPRLLLPESRLPGSKLTLFGEIIEELRSNRHKALVFSQFVDHLAIIREYLDEKGISYQYLDGSTPAGRRRERISAFQNGEGELFLISLKAGGSGLNLTAADYVIHMDPWWNPAVEDQASDRAHRIGQTRPVTIYRLVTKGTIEEQIVKLHREKRELASSLLVGTDLAGRLDVGELMKLLRG